MHMKKGILFSLDASIALLIFMVILIGTLYYFSKTDISQNQEGLVLTSMDVLAVLEKSGKLGDATEGLDEISPYIDQLSYNNCFKIDILLSSGSKIFSTKKKSCDYSSSVVTARRVFMHNGNIYLVRIEGWVK
jgi:hypothetical protein